MVNNAEFAVQEAPRRTSSASPGSYLLEVTLKPDQTDPEGLEALRLLHRAGVLAARSVRAGRLYDLRGPLNLGHVHVAARELLCDCVTQNFRVCAAAASGNTGAWRVEVWPLPTMADALAHNVLGAWRELGLPEITLRCGRSYLVTGKCGRNHLEKAVGRWLANPVIHHFTVGEAS